MNIEQVEHIRAILDEERPEPVVTATTARAINPEPRTLIYGYTLERDTFHVYYDEGTLHRLVYRNRTQKPEGAEVVSYDSANVMLAKNMIPSKRSYPQFCDYPFVMYLAKEGINPNFTTWQEPDARIQQPFIGFRRIDIPTINA